MSVPAGALVWMWLGLGIGTPDREHRGSQGASTQKNWEVDSPLGSCLSVCQRYVYSAEGTRVAAYERKRFRWAGSTEEAGSWSSMPESWLREPGMTDCPWQERQ